MHRLGTGRPMNGQPNSTGDRSSTITLRPFEEVVGRLEEVRLSDSALTVELSIGQLRFPAASPAADICRDQLVGQTGDTVAILRTLSMERPLRIRVVETESA